MSHPSPIQARNSGATDQVAPIRASKSFAAHLKSLERQIPLRSRYENFIGGKWVAPLKGGYFDNISPTTGAGDLPDSALPGARTSSGRSMPHMPLPTSGAARPSPSGPARSTGSPTAWSSTCRSWPPSRPTTTASRFARPTSPISRWRSIISAISRAACAPRRARSVELDDDTVAYHYHEPLGVVGQIIPWNFPILMAAWKLAPALAAGNAVVIKPAEQTPLSLLVFAELIQDMLPPGVLNIVNGFGLEAGKPLASSPRIGKIAFTGETTTGRLIMQYASENIIPVTLELGGKSPNIFFADVMREDDAFVDKALEGFAMFALNQGEVCTCPSRALVQRSIYDRFMERAVRARGKHPPGRSLRDEHADRRSGFQ